MLFEVSSTKAVLITSIYTDSRLAAFLIDGHLHAKSFGGHATGRLMEGMLARGGHNCKWDCTFSYI